MSMKEMALLKERIYPYVVAVVGVGLIRRSCVIEFFSSENLNDALTAIITVTSIIIGFIGAILPVILSMKNDSKVVQYVFQRDKRKLFLEYIKSTLAIGLLLIVCSIIPYFSDLYEDTFFYKNWPYAVMYMLICFLCATYRCLNNMLNLIFKLDDDLPHSLIREESDVKKDLDRRLQKQQSACGKGGH